MAVWLLYREGETYDYAELGEAEYDLRTSEIADDLCQNALAVGAPGLLMLAQTRSAYENALRNIDHAARFVNEASNVYGRMEQPDENYDFAPDVRRLAKRLFTLRKKISRAVEKMTGELDGFMESPQEGVKH